MTFAAEFELLLRACYPLLYVPTQEEERLETAIAASAQRVGNRAVYVWDFVEGYQGNPNSENMARRNPLQALEFIEKLPSSSNGVFILRDFQRFLEDISVSRKLRNLARRLKAEAKNIVMVAPQIQIPTELTEMITVVDFPLPNGEEIQGEIQRLLGGLGQTLDPKLKNELARAAQGLSMERIRRVLTRCLADHGQLEADDVELMLEEKRQSIRQTQILDFYPASELISDIGGLDNLKDWLLRRGGAFSDAARRYGLPYPRGLLLAGIQGTGKSLTAKAIAHHWHLPLLRLDVGRLFGGLVGESEARTRQMINLAEALAPCVFWIDEIDKAFGGMDCRGDGGNHQSGFWSFYHLAGGKNVAGICGGNGQ